MKKNATHFGRLQPAKPRLPGLRTKRRKFSPDISTNYALMLQIYCLNKKHISAQKELKYTKLTSALIQKSSVKPAVSLLSTVAHFFTEYLIFSKKARPAMVLVAE